jgi:cbb3-type cytochrome oxidase subunit 3
MSREIFLQSLEALTIIGVVAAIVFAITRLRFARAFAVAYMIVITIGVAWIASRTRDRAHASARWLHIDVDDSRRYGPLVDQRGLLLDEIAWARANRDNARAARTEAEVREIDRLLKAMGR